MANIKEAVVVGYGSIGKKHALNLQALGLQVMAIADTNEYLEDDGLNTYAPHYTNVQKCLEKEARGRLVVIASPNAYHAEQAITAMYNEAGAVFIEKPMAVNVPDAEDIDTLSKDFGIPVCVGFNWRYHAGFQKLLTLISTRPGALYINSVENVMEWPAVQKDPHNSHVWNETGSILFSSMPHAIDLARYVNGQLRTIAAVMDVPDAGKGNQHITLKADCEMGPVFIYNRWSSTAKDKTNLLLWTSPVDYIASDLAHGPMSNGGKTMHLQIMQAFVKKINGEEPVDVITLPTTWDGVHVCKVIDAIERSTENNTFEEITYE